MRAVLAKNNTPRILHPRAHHATVHMQRGAVDVAGGIAAQEEHGGGNVGRFADAALGDLFKEVGGLVRVAQHIVGQAGQHHAGGDGVDVDIVARAVDRHALGHHLGSALAGVVDALALPGDLTHDRGDVDDLAVVAVHHGRQHGAREEKHAAHVDIHHAVVFVVVHHRKGDELAGAGVVNQDVDGAVGREGGVDAGFDFLLRAHVDLQTQAFGALGFDLAAGFGQALQIDIADDQFGPFAGELHGGGLSDAGGGAGDDSYFSFKTVRHSFLFKI